MRRKHTALAVATAFLLAIATHASQMAQSVVPDEWLPLPEGDITRIAFGSCAKHWQFQAVWDSVIEQRPDVFLFIGDAIYADTDGKTAWQVTEDSLRGDWNRLADKPEFQRARASFPFMATWDNHDYGSHAGGADFPLKEESQRVFLDFFGEAPGSSRRKQSGIYDAKIFGPEGRRVQVILLDTRYSRGPAIRDLRSSGEKEALGIVGNYLPNNDPNVTLLGSEQWNWLEKQLYKPAEIRLIASSTQIVPDEKGMDEWGNYPLERQRLFDLLEDAHASGVILLTGNVHFSEISRKDDFSYPLHDFTSSGMTHVNESYARKHNKTRVSGPYVGINTGLVEIDWETGASPLIHLKTIRLDGAIAFERKVPLSELQFPR
jgi:alkaline phosphatase D